MLRGKTKGYGLSELEEILPDSFDSKVVVSKSPFKSPKDPSAERMGFFTDKSHSIEVDYEEKTNRKYGTPPSDILMSKEYVLYERGDEKRAFSIVDRLMHRKDIHVMLYEMPCRRGPLDDNEMECMLERAYSSLDEDFLDTDDIYVYLPDEFRIHKVKESVVERLGWGEASRLRLEVIANNTRSTLDEVAGILLLLCDF